MKTLVVSVIFSMLSLSAFCQQKAAKTPAPVKKTTAAVQYKCPVCGYTSTTKGDCPNKDKTTLVKVGDYYCPTCYMSSSKPGKCEMCGVDMKLMEAKK